MAGYPPSLKPKTKQNSDQSYKLRILNNEFGAVLQSSLEIKLRWRENSHALNLVLELESTSQ